MKPLHIVCLSFHVLADSSCYTTTLMIAGRCCLCAPELVQEYQLGDGNRTKSIIRTGTCNSSEPADGQCTCSCHTRSDLVLPSGPAHACVLPEAQCHSSQEQTSAASQIKADTGDLNLKVCYTEMSFFTTLLSYLMSRYEQDFSMVPF